MTKQAKQALQEAERLAKELVRKQAYQAKEQAIEKTWKAKLTERSEKRAAEEIKQSTRDRARRETLLAEEQAIAKAQKARKLRETKQPTG